MTELGTTWVAPGEGSTWRELSRALGPSELYMKRLEPRIRRHTVRPHPSDRRTPVIDERTNLLLTGSPIQPYDRQRWESGNVE